MMEKILGQSLLSSVLARFLLSLIIINVAFAGDVKESASDPASVMKQVALIKQKVAFPETAIKLKTGGEDWVVQITNAMAKIEDGATNGCAWMSLYAIQRLTTNFVPAVDIEMCDLLNKLHVTLIAAYDDAELKLYKEGNALLAEAVAVCAKATTPDEIIPIKEKMGRFRSKVKQVLMRIDERTMNGLMVEIDHCSSFLGQWKSLLMYLQINKSQQAVEMVRQLKSLFFKYAFFNDPAIQSRLSSISSLYTNAVTKGIEDLRDSCLKANTSEEVEAALSVFEKTTFQGQELMNDSQRKSVDQLPQVVRRWAGVLAAIELENYQDAINKITIMENDSYGSSLIPKKDLALRKAALLRKNIDFSKVSTDPVVAYVNEMMEKATTVEELSLIKLKLQNDLNRSGSCNSGNSDMQHLIGDIGSLESMRENVKNGMYANVFGLYSYRTNEMMHRWRPFTDKVRSQLRTEAIAGLCGIKDFSVPEEQTAEKVLQAYIDKVSAGKQWGLLLKYLEGYKIIFATNMPPSWLMDEISATKSFMAAGNFEKAEEYEKALSCYMSVLLSASNRAPVAESIAAIKRLKKEYPEAYQKSNQTTIPGQTVIR